MKATLCATDTHCLEGFYCDTPDREPWICTPAHALGDSCRRGRACQSGTCDFERGWVCAEHRPALRFGDACNAGDRLCPGFGGGNCVNGVCQPELFALLYCAPAPSEAFGPMSTGNTNGVRPDDLQGSARLTALNDGEFAALCEWATGVFAAQVTCRGEPVASAGCMKPTNPACVATVEHYRACFPAFVARLDGCRFDESASSGELVEILASTPECAGLRPCVETSGR